MEGEEGWEKRGKGEGGRGKGEGEGPRGRGERDDDGRRRWRARAGVKRNWSEPIAARVVDARVLSQAVRDT